MATIRRLRGRWQAQVRRKGLQPRAKSFDSKTDAEKWARSLEADLDRCGMLADTRPAEKMSVRDMFERYLTEITLLKRNASAERYRIKAMMVRPPAYRTLAMLSPADIALYRDDRLKVVAAPTVLKELNCLAHAIDIARKEWSITLPQNPCRMIRRPKPPRGRDRRLMLGEEERLLAAAGTGRSPWMAPLIKLALDTAMRQGELLGLRWPDIDLDRCIAWPLELEKYLEDRYPMALERLSDLPQYRAENYRCLPVQDEFRAHLLEHLLEAKRPWAFIIGKQCVETRHLPILNTMRLVPKGVLQGVMSEIRHDRRIGMLNPAPVEPLQQIALVPGCFGIPHARKEATPECSACPLGEKCGELAEGVARRMHALHGSLSPLQDSHSSNNQY